ncbi:MAG: hypothetical protein SF187_14165 [Deltaproteobacteria bacterium]|nr:hypothetical protein [Deltaproteobacteria bacterium]
MARASGAHGLGVEAGDAGVFAADATRATRRVREDCTFAATAAVVASDVATPVGRRTRGSGFTRG